MRERDQFSPKKQAQNKNQLQQQPILQSISVNNNLQDRMICIDIHVRNLMYTGHPVSFATHIFFSFCMNHWLRRLLTICRACPGDPILITITCPSRPSHRLIITGQEFSLYNSHFHNDLLSTRTACLVPLVVVETDSAVFNLDSWSLLLLD